MIKLKYGNTNTYLIDGLLFDTDMPGTMPRLFKAIKREGVPFESIRYVIASHYHPDHMGLISELMAKGVSLVVVEHQLEHVHFSDGMLKRQFGDRYKPIDETKAEVITAEASRAFLARIGISGEIVPTRSHSEDGIALALDDGQCFVGDLEPRSYLDAYEDNQLLKDDWETIMALNPTIVYSGHVNDQDMRQGRDHQKPEMRQRDR